MSEKFSSIEKVVGSASDQDKMMISAKVEDRFRDHSSEQLLTPELQEFELEKTSDEEKLIVLANQITNNFLIEQDLPIINIPVENVHIMSNEVWEKQAPKRGGGFFPEIQGVVVRRFEEKTIFLKTMIHEFLHFKSYGALQADENWVEKYRVGLVAYSRDGKKLYLNSLNEGLTEMLAKKLMVDCDDDIIEQERQQLDKIKQEFGHVRNEIGQPVLDDDVLYAYPGGNFYLPPRKEYPHKEQRQILQMLMEKIYQANGGKVSEDEIFKSFLDGAFKGNLLGLGKLVENSFGLGTFRKIAEADEDVEKLKEVVEGL